MRKVLMTLVLFVFTACTKVYMMGPEERPEESQVKLAPFSPSVATVEGIGGFAVFTMDFSTDKDVEVDYQALVFGTEGKSAIVASRSLTKSGGYFGDPLWYWSLQVIVRVEELGKTTVSVTYGKETASFDVYVIPPTGKG